MCPNKKLLAFALLLLAILSLSSCSRIFFMKLEGRLDEKVNFIFYESLESKEPTKHNITDFFIQEQQGESKWVTIWDLSGSAKLTQIVYGQNYRGLIEKNPAKELRRNIKYRVVAKDAPVTKPVGVAGAYFYFDESGNLHFER